MGAFFSPLNIVLLFSISLFFFPANIFRVKKLKETFAFIQQLDKNMSNLRTWLARIESELSKPVVYDVCDDQEIQKRLAEQQVGKCGMGFCQGPLIQTCLTLAVCFSRFTSHSIGLFLPEKADNLSVSLGVWGVCLLHAHPTIHVAPCEIFWIIFKMQTLIVVINKGFFILYFP